MPPANNSINYVELPMTDMAAAKRFYGDVFGWEFTDWGESYVSFAGAGLDGGFNGESGAKAQAPGVLIVLYTDKLEGKRDQIAAAGGEIMRDIFSFPGGRRFHFRDPGGNELAVWSDQGAS